MISCDHMEMSLSTNYNLIFASDTVFMEMRPSLHGGVESL